MAPGNNSNHWNRGGGGGGRGGGRSNGSSRNTQPGRGGGNRNSNRNSNSNSNYKSYEKKYIFAPAAATTPNQPQTPSNYATYHAIVEHICQYVQTTFANYGHDCAKSLRDGEMIDLSLEEPEREMVEEGNNASERMTQAIRQNGLDIKYTAEITTHAQRVQHLAANMTKAYSLILGTYCTSTMRSRIKLHPEFQATILDNPIGLLKEIQSCTNAPVRSQYPLIEPVHLLKTFLGATQHHKESLEDWTQNNPNPFCFFQPDSK